MSRGSQQSKRVSISAGDRWAIIGASGTGKTTFTLRLLRELWRFYQVPTYIINSKPDPGLARLARPVKTATAPRLPVFGSSIQVWEPPDDSAAEYDAYLQAILKARRPAIVEVNELSSLGGNSGASFPVGLKRLLKQGRSLRITTIIESQEVAYIPRQVIGQATHLVAFDVRNEYERRVLAGHIGIDTFRIPDPHGFWYTRMDQIGSATYYPDLRKFF